MDMCYDMKLVLPDNAVIIYDNEMMYVEGGTNYEQSLGYASTYFKRIAGVAVIGDLVSAVAVVGTYGASVVTGAYFTSVITSAVKCYNKCQKWLDSGYDGKKSSVISGCITAYGLITSLTVTSKKLVKK